MRKNLTQVRFITLYYSYFLGLRSVVIGLLLAIGMLPKQGDLTIPCTLFPLAILAYIGVDRYYARTYGRVKPKMAGHGRQIVLVLGLAVLGWLALGLDTEKILPVSAVGLLLSLIPLTTFLSTGAAQRKELLALFPEVFLSSAVMAFVSLLPLTGFIWWQALGAQSLVAAIEIVYGILLILSGIWGHLRLGRVLKVREEGMDGITL